MQYVKDQFVVCPHFHDLRQSRLKYTDVIVYIAVRSFNNPQNRCFPSYEAIAKRAECSRDYVIKALKRLSKASLITITRSTKFKGVNCYHFATSHMFEQIPYELFDQDIDIYAKSMMLLFRQLAVNGRLKYVFKLERMAKCYGLTYRTVYKQITKLIDLGYIIRGTGKRKICLMLTDKIDWPWGYGNSVDEPKGVPLLLIG